MIVNGKEYNLDSLLKSLDVNAHSFRKVGNLMLTEKEISILDANFIDYENATSLKDLRIKIQAVIDDEDLDSDDIDGLDYVLDMIAERDYYENTNK